MEAIKNLKLVEAARAEARALVAKDIALTKHPLIRSRVESVSKSLHLE